MNILYIDHYAGSLSMGIEFRPFYFARDNELNVHSKGEHIKRVCLREQIDLQVSG